MPHTQPQQRSAIGMVGLGVMGRNLVLNTADDDFSVAGYDKEQAKVEALRQESKKRDVRGAADIKEFIALLHKPRAVMRLVPGEPKEAYERVRPVLEAAAAKVNGDPCVTYLGVGLAGHFVKMVHNGIEYGVMPLIAEPYDLMKRGLGLNDDELHDVFSAWNNGELNGYLMEITSHSFSKVDETTGQRLIDDFLDMARQKGTGMWASQSAMELHVPIPTIDLAEARAGLV